MTHKTTPLGNTIRKHRRTAGMTQEQLAEFAGLSVGVISKLERGGAARVETLHSIAAALGVPTSTFFAPGSPEPVRADETNRQVLTHLRRALMPPVGIKDTLVDQGQAESIPELRRKVEDGITLYNADRYESVAEVLPGLLMAAEAAVSVAPEEDQAEAIRTRVHALLLAGKYLTQVRQYDMAYQALSEAIRLARENGETMIAATGVIGLTWLFLRLDRFEDCMSLAAATADEIEPRMSTASVGQFAAWGELSLRIAAAAVRDNRPDDAENAQRMAATAASAVGIEHRDYREHWGKFGPVTVELKRVEELSLAGDAQGVLRRADDGLLSRGAMDQVGRPSMINWNRHRLDVARAHVLLGSTHDAMGELIRVRRSSGTWMQHQPLARYVMQGILETRKRPLTREMRLMAAHLSVDA